MAQGPSYARFSLRGYSPWPAEKIACAVDAGTPIADIPGDFTVVAEGARNGAPYTRIVSSVVAAPPYYYARDRRAGRTFAHGPTVFDVVRLAQLPWRWNGRAISFLALLGHTVGDDTLHPDVLRVPNAAVITVEGEEAPRVERQ